MPWLRPALALVASLSMAGALGACGGGGASGEDRAATSATTAPAPSAPPRATPPGRPSPYDPPASVPRQGGGNPADPADVAVVRTWVDELRAGHIGRAADTFADGARIQNGTPVITLRSERERRAYMEAGFPCGARVTDAQDGGNGFVVVQFRIVDRVGGSPGCSAGGASAYAAIEVSGGRIRQWYRLPDPARIDPSDVTPS